MVWLMRNANYYLNDPLKGPDGGSDLALFLGESVAVTSDSFRFAPDQFDAAGIGQLAVDAWKRPFEPSLDVTAPTANTLDPPVNVPPPPVDPPPPPPPPVDPPPPPPPIDPPPPPPIDPPPPPIDPPPPPIDPPPPPIDPPPPPTTAPDVRPATYEMVYDPTPGGLGWTLREVAGERVQYQLPNGDIVDGNIDLSLAGTQRDQTTTANPNPPPPPANSPPANAPTDPVAPPPPPANAPTDPVAPPPPPANVGDQLTADSAPPADFHGAVPFHTDPFWG